MGKIYFLIGKSASGKDTLYNRLKEDPSLGLVPYVGFTTRPMRDGEREGVEYHFTDRQQLEAFRSAGTLIEERVYHTVYGDWYYYSVDSADVDLRAKSYIYIGTLESFVKMREYYGADKVIPVYIEVDDGLRLERALSRERQQEHPGYEELCRRFLADAKDFSEENLAAAGITKRFQNVEMETCLQEIRREIFQL